MAAVRRVAAFRDAALSSMRYGLPVRLLFLSAVVVLSAWPAAARADWRPVERIEPYSISGSTGRELYASIGERGPKAGVGRVIAFTDFKLTWTRDYQPRGGACVLVSARPKLTIIYKLPKPSTKLPAPVRRNWEAFVEGVEKHERVHGDMIKDLVTAIEAATVGLTVPDDPKCKKIRNEMTTLLTGLSQAQRQKSRDFDRTELTDGGNVHQLVLRLVNGG